MVEMTARMRMRWEVVRVRWRWVLIMYITSSTAEVMKGGFERVETGRVRDRVKSEGASSSWKAFSTERRMKKVVIAEKGRKSRSWTLVDREEARRTGGMVRGVVSSAGSGWIG